MSKDCMNTLRCQLWGVMNEMNYTQEKMAEVCGISLRALCDILNYQHKGIRLETLVSISVGTGIPLVNLIDAKGLAKKDNGKMIRNFYADFKQLYTNFEELMKREEER